VKRFPLFFIGVLGTFALAWIGVVAVPQAQLGKLQPQIDEDNTSDVYPINVGGVADQGRRVFVANGCVSCHSQQVRGAGTVDAARGWGDRRTVPLDYIYGQPAELGLMRNGPDLTNIGVRQPNAEWHYLHLYNPRAVTPGSIMPPFRFLFEKRKISGERSADALYLSGDDAVPDGYEVVPTPQAKALVGYLLSRDKSHPLKEIKVSKEGAAK
jgi:cytochrome c oxidase cbb3-type subunit 2